MSDIKTIELYVAMDANGCWAVGDDPEAAADKYTDDYTLDGPLRVAKLTVRMSAPVVVEAQPVDVPDEDTTVEVKSS